MAEEDADPTGSVTLSFSGSGYLVVYQIGVIQALQDLAPEILKSASRVCGASAGSLAATALVCGVNLEDFQNFVTEAGKKARESTCGPLLPTFNLLHIVQKGLNRFLPANAHQLASGRLHIALTRLSDWKNVLVSDYRSNEELIQALMCSCFVPFYCGFVPPSFRGVRYVDGGFTSMQPLFGLKSLITISPYTGEHDICPRECPVSYNCFEVLNTSFQVSIENLSRLTYSLFPPEPMVLKDFHCQGYKDAVLFLHNNK
ncbi:omega-hydroxyceramide transacylase isoform X2 [Pleurodeles waltl]|uniref:omega-hydroxyceramide transacylase isoform X2 n=1 Tax=Pleurodeles waltl TaxID=8319 RepID=UPI00370974FE